MSLLLECLVTTHWGQVTSSFGVMSLRANVNFMTEFLLLYFILGLLYIRLKLYTDGFYKPYYWFITELRCFYINLITRLRCFYINLITDLRWFYWEILFSKCFALPTCSLKSMNSPTSCWHFSMYFQVIKVAHVACIWTFMESRRRRVWLYFSALMNVWSCWTYFTEIDNIFWDLCFVNSECF